MKRYRLSRDVQLSFRNFHTVRAKAGAPVDPRTCGGDRVEFSIEPAHVETDSPRGDGSMWQHDTRYFFIWVRFDAVEEWEG